MNKATAPRFPCLAGQRGETAYSLAFEFPRFTSRNKPDAFRIRNYRPKGNAKIISSGSSGTKHPPLAGCRLSSGGISPKPKGRNPLNALGIKAILPRNFKHQCAMPLQGTLLPFPNNSAMLPTPLPTMKILANDTKRTTIMTIVFLTQIDHQTHYRSRFRDLSLRLNFRFFTL